MKVFLSVTVFAVLVLALFAMPTYASPNCTPTPQPSSKVSNRRSRSSAHCPVHSSLDERVLLPVAS